MLFGVLCISLISSHATVCADRFFIEQHVTLGICKNHARGLAEAALYYKGVAKALNDYVAIRIERGEFKNKRFDIYMLDPCLTRPHCELVQNAKTYFIRTGETKSLMELMCLIDEFTQPGFTAIDLGLMEYSGDEEYDRKLRQLERFEKRVFSKVLLQADMDTIRNRPYLTFQKDKLKLVFQNDKVKCFIGDTEIPHNLIGTPWVIRDRYIFQECGVFKVYQDAALIKTFRYQKKDAWDCEYMGYTEVYNRWVNFDEYGEVIFSYSYDKNRFYAVDEDALSN